MFGVSISMPSLFWTQFELQRPFLGLLSSDKQRSTGATQRTSVTAQSVSTRELRCGAKHLRW